MSEATEGTETSTPSIEESLAAGFEGATSIDTGSTTDKTTAPPPAASGDPNAAPNPLEPPKHWTEVDRTLFGKAPRDIQQRWIDREAETARGLDAKFQEIAGFRKERDQYSEILQPYQRELDMQGLTAPQFVKSLVSWQRMIQENPREGILRLAQTYGVDPAQLLDSTTQVDPNFAKLQEKLNQVETKFSGFLSEAQKREQEANLSRVQTFAEEKGPDGKALRPYFDKVSGDIVSLMKAQPGLALDTAYQKAVRMNDEVWEQMQADKAAATAKQTDAERLAAVEKAKKAAVSNGPGNAKGSPKKLTLEEELGARWEGSLN